jgi:hypothetical protein
MQSLFEFLSHLVLFLSLTSLVFAAGAYMALVLKRRKPLRRRREAGLSGEVTLLRRYVPPERESP